MAVIGVSFTIGLAVLLRVVHAAVATTGSTVSLNDLSYFIPPEAIDSLSVPHGLKAAFEVGSFVPITVITTSTGYFSASELSGLTSNYSATDDVWQSGFLDALYVQYTGSKPLSPYQICSGNLSIPVVTSSRKEAIPSGPYFMSSGGKLYKAYRLYSDFQKAFTETVYQSEMGSFSALTAGIVGQSLAVAVPSRLYYTKTAEKPLAGVRLGVKDIYDIAGLHTSNGNRAWYQFYPAATATAEPVQRLIDAGAVVIGKMVTSQFANGETVHHEPFNPRGDGYQDTSSSSSGPGAGEGAYPWIDITLGSDTGGSVRGPSEAQGLFGNRPSHGLVELTNTMPLAPELDTAGLLCRDPALWQAAATVMYGSNITFDNFSKYPSKILTIDFPDSADDEADSLILDFVDKLADFLSANASAFNMSASWASANPSAAPISEILNITYPLLISKEQIRLVRDPFYADYAAKYDGRRPFVDPAPLVRWSFGDNSSATIEEAVANKTQFMNWFNNEVLAPDAKSCSSTLMLYVGSDAETTYRNTYWDPPEAPYGFSSGRISVFSEAPDFVVPIGQAAYNSTVTDHVEYLPVTLDFLVAKGCDGMLFSLINDLLAAGLVQVSKTGQSSVTGGQILYKRTSHAQ